MFNRWSAETTTPTVVAQGRSRTSPYPAARLNKEKRLLRSHLDEVP